MRHEECTEEDLTLEGVSNEDLEILDVTQLKSRTPWITIEGIDGLRISLQHFGETLEHEGTHLQDSLFHWQRLDAFGEVLDRLASLSSVVNAARKRSIRLSTALTEMEETGRYLQNLGKTK